MELKDTVFCGFAKLYNGANVMMGNLVIMSDFGLGIANSTFYFYLIKNGNCICSFYGYDNIKNIKKTDFGLEYIYSYKDDLGQVYYITPITKNIVVDF